MLTINDKTEMLEIACTHYTTKNASMLHITRPSKPYLPYRQMLQENLVLANRALTFKSKKCPQTLTNAALTRKIFHGPHAQLIDLSVNRSTAHVVRGIFPVPRKYFWRVNAA